MKNLIDLPDELLLRIFSAAPDAGTLVRLAAACRALMHLASVDALWRDRLKSDLLVLDTLNPGAPGLGIVAVVETCEFERARAALRTDSAAATIIGIVGRFSPCFPLPCYR